MILKFFKKMFSKQKRIETKIKDILFRSNKHCHYCNIKLYRDECTLDHVIPISKGGETKIENSVICCSKCNQLKCDSDYDDFKTIINTIEKRDFYWKRFEERINNNIIIDIVYPYMSEKIKEYNNRLRIIDTNRNQLLKIYSKDHKKIKDLQKKKNNIEKEIFKLRKKMKKYKQQIPTNQ